MDDLFNLIGDAVFWLIVATLVSFAASQALRLGILLYRHREGA